MSIKINRVGDATVKPFHINGCEIYGLGTMTVNRKWCGESFASSRIVLAILLGERSKSGRLSKSLVPLAKAVKGCKDATLAEAWERYTNYSSIPSPLADIRTAEMLVALSSKYSALPILNDEADSIESTLAVYGDFAKWREAVKAAEPKANKLTSAERFAAFAKSLGDDFGPLARAWVTAHETDDERKLAKAEAERKAKAEEKAARDKLVKAQLERINALEGELEKANKAGAKALAKANKAEANEAEAIKSRNEAKAEVALLKAKAKAK